MVPLLETDAIELHELAVIVLPEFCVVKFLRLVGSGCPFYLFTCNH